MRYRLEMERKQQFEELKLSVPWGHVTAKAWGLSTDKKILAVHGILDNAGSFNRIINLLPKDCYIVCIDLPGHGFSSHFHQSIMFNYFSYVLTIHHVLSALQWNTCIYMGHSFGGHIGTMFSIIYPERIEKLILLDSLVALPILNKNLISNLRKVCDINIKTNANNTSRLYTKDEALYAIRCIRFSALNSDAAEALFERGLTQIDNLYKYNRDSRLKEFISPLFNVDQIATCIKEISIPCLIIFSSSTLRTNEWMKYMLKQLNNSDKIFTIACVNGNHDVHNNNPERVAPHICKFLYGNNKSKL